MLSQKNEKEFHKGRMQILSELTKLRQLCCDPGLLLEDYHGESAKTDMCMELIVNAVGAGHKILLFSQFTSMLDRLTERQKKEGIDYYLLTGSVNKEKRMQMVESFNNDDVPFLNVNDLLLDRSLRHKFVYRHDMLLPDTVRTVCRLVLHSRHCHPL